VRGFVANADWLVLRRSVNGFSLAAANKNLNVIKTFLPWCVDQAVLTAVSAHVTPAVFFSRPF
jgi:hypothetical protein